MFTISRDRKFRRYRFQREFHLNVIAVFIGFISGLAGFIFRISIEFLDEHIFGDNGFLSIIKDLFGEIAAVVFTILVPTIGGFIVGYAIYKQFPLAKGHGIPNILEVVRSHESINPKTPIGKFVLSILTIGSGLSAGSEGPIAQIGAGAGSYIAKLKKYRPGEVNILIAAGAGSGIAAVFNAPLGGTIFALEIIIATITPHSAVPVAVASITAVGINFLLLGNLDSVFKVPIHTLESALDIPFILLLGIIAGIIAVIWQKSLIFAEEYFDKNKIKLYYNTALGGLLIGIIIVFFSIDIRGAGYPIIHWSLGNQFDELTTFTGIILGLFLMVTCIFKIIATSLSLGSGVSGGIFAPSLFMGATLGAGYSIILNSTLNLQLNPGLFALLGLAAVFAAAARAPITMIILTVEMSGDFALLPSLMIIVLVSFITHKTLVEESIYTEKLSSKGISSTARTTDEMLNFICLDEIMTKETIAILENTLVTDIMDIIMAYKHTGYPVIDNNGCLSGMITMYDLRRAKAQQLDIKNKTVSEIMSKKLITIYPNASVKEAMDLMYKNLIGRIPISVKKDDCNKLVGIITRSDLIQTIESFEGFLEYDRSCLHKEDFIKVEEPIIDLLPSEYLHLRDKVVIVSKDIISEAEAYMKKTFPKKDK